MIKFESIKAYKYGNAQWGQQSLQISHDQEDKQTQLRPKFEGVKKPDDNKYTWCFVLQKHTPRIVTGT